MKAVVASTPKSRLPAPRAAPRAAPHVVTGPHRSNNANACRTVDSDTHSDDHADSHSCPTVSELLGLSPDQIVEVISELLKVNRETAELIVRDILVSMNPGVDVARRVMQMLKHAYLAHKHHNEGMDKDVVRARDVYEMLTRLRVQNKIKEQELDRILYCLDDQNIDVTVEEDTLERLGREESEYRTTAANTMQFLVDARSRHKAEQQRVRDADVFARKERERYARSAENLSNATAMRDTLEDRVAKTTADNHALELQLQELLCHQIELRAQKQDMGRLVEVVRADLQDMKDRLRVTTLGASFLTHVAM
jgi:hypothetical protein